MPSYTIYSGSDDGYVLSSGVSWTIVKSGSNLQAVDTSTAAGVGKTLVVSTYVAHQAALVFDTSSIPDSATVDDVDLVLTSQSNTSITADLEARAHDWGPTLSTSDWQSDWDSEDLLASYDLSGGWVSGTEYTLSGVPAFNSYIDKTGSTYLMVSISTIDGIAPAGNENPTIYLEEQAGTSQDPRLEIQTTEDPDFTPFVIWL